MTISARLSRKLQEALGQEAAEDLVSWMEERDSHESDSREAIRADFAEVRQEMHASIADLRQEMRDGFASIRQELHVAMSRLETLIEKRTADLMKWSFLFWVGAVAAIAALAGVLR